MIELIIIGITLLDWMDLFFSSPLFSSSLNQVSTISTEYNFELRRNGTSFVVHRVVVVQLKVLPELLGRFEHGERQQESGHHLRPPAGELLYRVPRNVDANTTTTTRNDNRPPSQRLRRPTYELSDDCQTPRNKVRTREYHPGCYGNAAVKIETNNKATKDKKPKLENDFEI